MKFFYLVLYFCIFNFSVFSGELALGLKKVDDYKIIGPKNFLEDFKTFQKKNIANIVIEIPKGTNEKWEVSKFDGSLEHNFFQGKPRIIKNTFYLVNYGMIPRTVLPLKFGGDGDPLDAILLGETLPRGTVAQGKIIGVMRMKDMGQNDDKIILTHKDSKFFKYENIDDLQNEDPEILSNIKSWFISYKGNNFIEFIRYGSKKEAYEIIVKASKDYKKIGLKIK